MGHLYERNIQLFQYCQHFLNAWITHYVLHIFSLKAICQHTKSDSKFYRLVALGLKSKLLDKMTCISKFKFLNKTCFWSVLRYVCTVIYLHLYFSNGCISLVGRIVKNEIPESLMFALEIAQAMAVAGEYENSGWPQCPTVPHSNLV